MNVAASGFTIVKLKLLESARRVSVDGSTMQAIGDSLFFISLSSSAEKLSRQISSDAKISQLNHDSLFFNFSKRGRKTVPVKLISEISFAKQFQLADSIKISPQFVEIFGKENEVAKINFIETKPLTLKNLNKTTVLRLPFHSTRNIIGTSFDSVTVTIPVDEFTEGQLTVPVQILNLPDGYSLKLFPDKVLLKYNVSISNLNKVTEDMFQVVVDFLEIKQGENSKLKVSIVSQPQFISSVKILPEKLEYIIRK
jgi:YbbR domain-containing protein